MSVTKSLLILLVCALATACTPAYTRQGGKELMAEAHLTDSIDVQRSNPRQLSRHGQVCLISDTTGTEAGLAMLRTMQMAFGGYFVAVGIENEPMDYMRALAGNSCPGAAYVFYVQPSGQPLCLGSGPPVAQPVAGAATDAVPAAESSPTCEKTTYSELVITIISGGDRTLMDRIKFSVRKGFLPINKQGESQLTQAFERLAAALTGVAG